MTGQVSGSFPLSEVCLSFCGCVERTVGSEQKKTEVWTGTNRAEGGKEASGRDRGVTLREVGEETRSVITEPA